MKKRTSTTSQQYRNHEGLGRGESYSRRGEGRAIVGNGMVTTPQRTPDRHRGGAGVVVATSLGYQTKRQDHKLLIQKVFIGDEQAGNKGRWSNGLGKHCSNQTGYLLHHNI